jgi:hypothetical protein
MVEHTVAYGSEAIMIHNVHSRELPVPAAEAGRLLDRIASTDDPLWPAPAWPPIRFDRPLQVGADGGHGPIRYAVTEYRPGRLVGLTFADGMGLRGGHRLEVEPLGPDRCVLRHVIEGRPTGRMRLAWPLMIRWLHDALIEDLLDRAERALGSGPARPARWTPLVRLLRRIIGGRPRTVPVPETPLLATALPRVDFADAYAVRLTPGVTTDPQVWADAIFHDPPTWVVALLGLRQALAGPAGIERGSSSSFATVARDDHEVLLGSDAGHLDFRVSVRVADDQVTATTVVRRHNRRGRLYFALVEPIHPYVVRAMLARAGRRVVAGVSS